MLSTEKLLIVVDMVNGFVKEGLMHDTKIMDTVDAQLTLLKKFKETNQDIIFFCDSHPSNASELNKFPPHCLEGSHESLVIDELMPYADNIYLKNSTCGLFAKGFMQDLEQNQNLKEISVVGCCSDICVLNLVTAMINFFDEHNRLIKVIVYKDAIETFNSESHNRDEYNTMAIKLMSQTGAICTTTKEK